MDPLKLPIRQYAQQIAESVRDNPVTVVIGETGSGKTTQIAQLLEEAGLIEGGGMIGVTQPRRVAAVMVARRVAFERGGQVGEEVGYAVRFEERTSRRTRIKYLTDGTLLRECLEDPSLAKYAVLVLDEAHERSLNTDILFGLLKELVATRQPRLRLVVTSATLDGEKFSAYFNNCPVFHVPGRTFPVEVIHSLEDHSQEYMQAAIDTAIDIHCNQPEGDILIFLTGQAEIDKAVRQLNEAVRMLPEGTCGDLMVLPLYAALPPEMQARVFAPPPPGVRRVVVATNIAETSVTVDGVVYVIDAGMVKQKDHNPRTGMDSLSVVPISRVQATQRAGRAGRTRPGKCFRLYTKKFYERQMPDATLPEIQRTSLVGAVLYLKSLPLSLDVLGFDYLDAPAREALQGALRQLYALDAIDRDGGITETGRRMALLPLDPSLSRALLAARELGCLQETLTVAAMLSPESSVFMGNKGPEQLLNEAERQQQQQQQAGGFSSGGGGGSGYGRGRQGLGQRGRALLKELMAEGLGDHVLLLRLYQSWEQAGHSIDWCREVGVDGRSMRFARDIRQQLERIIGPDGTGFGQPSSRQRQQQAEGQQPERQQQEGREGRGSAGDGSSARHEQRQEGQRHREEGGRDREGGKGREGQGGEDDSSRKREREGDRMEGSGREKDREGREDRHHERRGSAGSYKRRRHSGAASIDSVRMALTVGFANRLARRMVSHNGYRTLGEGSALAQLHPSCARIATDEDGLLPEWVVYHELVSTGKVFLSKVCPVEAAWVQALLPKLQDVDVQRLSGGKTGQAAKAAAEAREAATEAAAAGGLAQAAGTERRNTDDAVAAARARFLARKAARGK